MLLTTIDNQIVHALQRLRTARMQGWPDHINEWQERLDTLLDQRNALT